MVGRGGGGVPGPRKGGGGAVGGRRRGRAARGAGLPHATAQAALASASRGKLIDGPFGQARLSRTMPDIRRNSSRLALGYSRPTRFHNQASRIVRLRRSDSSHIERNSASCQPCAWKNREPSAGANWY